MFGGGEAYILGVWVRGGEALKTRRGQEGGHKIWQ